MFTEGQIAANTLLVAATFLISVSRLSVRGLRPSPLSLSQSLAPSISLLPLPGSHQLLETQTLMWGPGFSGAPKPISAVLEVSSLRLSRGVFVHPSLPARARCFKTYPGQCGAPGAPGVSQGRERGPLSLQRRSYFSLPGPLKLKDVVKLPLLQMNPRSRVVEIWLSHLRSLPHRHAAALPGASYEAIESKWVLAASWGVCTASKT